MTERTVTTTGAAGTGGTPADRVSIGTPLTATATRVLLLGSGELGKEVAIEFQRLGVEVVAADRYADAPAMQVAHRSHVLPMLDGAALRRLVEEERPDLVVPEIEAIATDTLAELDAAGTTRVVPTARAVRLTMDREGIRRLAAEELGLPTSRYRFADTPEEFAAAVDEIGLPCVVKPVMSSSGRGQSVVRDRSQVPEAWHEAETGGRGAPGDGSGTRVIVEAFVPFDYELTLLTVVHAGGTTFLDPVRHVQVDGDYRESWQGEEVPAGVLAEARRIAGAVTAELCRPAPGATPGRGLFGVELFVRGGDVLFSEVSPRPHDTGLVTLVSQDLSEFALHARAVLGLPVPEVTEFGPAASCAVIAEGSGVPVFDGVGAALAEPTTQVRLFGKPRVDGARRVAVALARGTTVAEARDRARRAAAALRVRLV